MYNRPIECLCQDLIDRFGMLLFNSIFTRRVYAKVRVTTVTSEDISVENAFQLHMSPEL